MQLSILTRIFPTVLWLTFFIFCMSRYIFWVETLKQKLFFLLHLIFPLRSLKRIENNSLGVFFVSLFSSFSSSTTPPTAFRWLLLTQLALMCIIFAIDCLLCCGGLYHAMYDYRSRFGGFRQFSTSTMLTLLRVFYVLCWNCAMIWDYSTPSIFPLTALAMRSLFAVPLTILDEFFVAITKYIFLIAFPWAWSWCLVQLVILSVKQKAGEWTENR